ncbi:PREDICTED: putative P2Y purinoceptor 10 [Nanorana parkeri]|uniref:putative P2Y purinoceptor 10 n=1 Tax=Nanorana parkeri TaxID=125878 RepID=UPI00085459A7|nr:PREDICTED: putative P2Y purinoceptor 10 [Nanorana parkeri]XP_018422086.1 PREDICTED: putative P2Y purinoceptor 10 [Nanorana parkeri]
MPSGNFSNCSRPFDFQHTLYAITYTAIFIPGLLSNSVALWVLRSFITKNNKAIIFMINLATADLAHVLSLPLRIYYYINHSWPFKHFACLLCFYLKYLNMYASIMFLTLISVQRYIFTANPFKAKDWKRRYDVGISICVWVVVGTACLPFPLYRSSGGNTSTTSCFADLGNNQINMVTMSVMLIFAELLGFIIPMTVITYSSLRTRTQLKLNSMQSMNRKGKDKALRLIITCACVFFICFAPYHINFFFYVMVSTNAIQNCTAQKIILTFHPISISLASLNCCLDPILYFFTASEFKSEMARRSSSMIHGRLMSRESASSI